MTKPAAPPSRGRREWVCGYVRRARYVRATVPYRPLVVACLDGDTVLALEETAPDGLRAALERVLRRALADAPAPPAKLRVGERSLTDTARAVVGPEVTVRAGSTPELDAVLDAFGDDESQLPESFLDGGAVDARAVAEWFEAAARLASAAPWSTVPDDTVVFSVDAPAFDLRDAAAVVHDGSVGPRGVTLFRDFDAALMFHGDGDAAHALSPLGGLLSVEFRDLVPDALRAEVRAHAWTLATAGVIPVIARVDDDGVRLPLSTRDVQLATALASGLARMTRDHGPRLRESGGATVQTRVGPLTLTLPHPEAVASNYEHDMAVTRTAHTILRAFLASELRGRIPGLWREVAIFAIETLLRVRLEARGGRDLTRWTPRQVQQGVRNAVSQLADTRHVPRLVDACGRFFAWMAATDQMPADVAASLQKAVIDAAGEASALTAPPAPVVPSEPPQTTLTGPLGELAAVFGDDTARAVDDWARNAIARAKT